MAGGTITTPELVAAVSNTGALGSLGAGYMSPDAIRSAIKKIKQLTQKPFNVNLFIPAKSDPAHDLTEMKELLSSLWYELSDIPFEISLSSPSFDEQVQVILEEKVPLFSFTFGIPSTSLIERFKQQGTWVCGTATTPDEAEQLEKAGVDAIVCQGEEAGGHQGGFSSPSPPLWTTLPSGTDQREGQNTPHRSRRDHGWTCSSSYFHPRRQRSTTRNGFSDNDRKWSRLRLQGSSAQKPPPSNCSYQSFHRKNGASDHQCVHRKTRGLFNPTLPRTTLPDTTPSIPRYTTQTDRSHVPLGWRRLSPLPNSQRCYAHPTNRKRVKGSYDLEMRKKKPQVSACGVRLATIRSPRRDHAHILSKPFISQQ